MGESNPHYCCHCDREIVKLGPGTWPKSCLDCRNIVRLAGMRLYHQARKDDPEYQLQRRIARKKVYQKELQRPEHLAQKRAYLIEWRNANREQMSVQWSQWYQENKDLVRKKTQRRRARLLAAFVSDVDPVEIWERDKGVCGLCGELIDPGVLWPDRMSKTLDHIVPLVRGGTHEPANVQLAHAVCNSRKNDRER